MIQWVVAIGGSIITSLRTCFKIGIRGGEVESRLGPPPRSIGLVKVILGVDGYLGYQSISNGIEEGRRGQKFFFYKEGTW